MWKTGSAKQSIADGLLTVFIQHTSCSLVMQEECGSRCHARPARLLRAACAGRHERLPAHSRRSRRHDLAHPIHSDQHEPLHPSDCRAGSRSAPGKACTFSSIARARTGVRCPSAYRRISDRRAAQPITAPFAAACAETPASRNRRGCASSTSGSGTASSARDHRLRLVLDRSGAWNVPAEPHPANSPE